MNQKLTDCGRKLRALHQREGAFVMPNPWDIGSARILAAMGFEALATTSGGCSIEDHSGNADHPSYLRVESDKSNLTTCSGSRYPAFTLNQPAEPRSG